MNNFVKRLLSALLCLCLAVGALPARAEEGPQTVTVSTAQDLLDLAQSCRLDSWSRGLTVVLAADIDLTDSGFSGIPTFGGTLEGGGHTISGLDLSGDGSVQGLFRYLQQGAVVRDLTVSGDVHPGGTRTEVGGLVGENAGTLQSCTFSGTVTGTDQVGGLAGCNTVTGTITGCTISGSVYGNHFVGGAAGRNDGVISECSNTADINTTISQNEVRLDDLTVEDLLTTERAADITDIGGLAGSSAGVVRGCVNRGAVGYAHIGYNVGGIAGSQTGYIEGCVNYGTVNARKEGGGIVGQMEPAGVLQYSQDTLQQLQGELDTLQGLMNRATADASASSSELNARFTDLQNRVESARSAVDTLLGQLADGVDINAGNLTLTTLADLTGQANAGASVQGSGSADAVLNPAPTPEATPADPTPEPEPTAAPEPTEEPTAEPEPQPTEEPADRTGEVHERPRRNAPELSAEGEAQADGSAQSDGAVSLDGEMTLSLPDLTVSGSDGVTAARNSLSGSLTAISEGVEALNSDTGDHTQALIRDIQAITDQLNRMGNTLLGAAENANQGTLYEDVSDEDTDGDTEGKVFNCRNAGTVCADLNAGGIAGAMARENDLDPEDDTRISGSTSLNMTYKTRIVVRDCTNQGSVQAKKQCAGGIVGSMDLGSVLYSDSTADLLLDGTAYVGGIAGQSKSAIRSCAAKGRLSGSRYVGGIAGCGYTLTDCRSMVQAKGEEKVGAIAGGLLSGDAPDNALNDWQDIPSDVQGNCFVSETLGGIDGVSYAQQAEPVSFEAFAALAGQENLPETFRTITLTFQADGNPVAVIPVAYGSSFDLADAPEIPAREGCTAAWEDFVHDRIVFDETIEAVYTPYATVIQSDEQRDGRPILLAEGSFAGETLTLTPQTDSPVPGTVESWQFTLPADASDQTRLRYLPVSPDTALYLRGADGSWRQADATADGSYLVFAVQPGDDAFAAVTEHPVPWAGVAAAAAAAVLAVLLAAARRRRRVRT